MTAKYYCDQCQTPLRELYDAKTERTVTVETVDVTTTH